MLGQLNINNVRNITDIRIQPSAGINLILGSNGSGKTSVLEAIHMLALGKSFRSRSLKSVVQFSQPQLQVTAKTSSNIPVGLQYSIDSGLSIRLNNAPLKRLSELATQLPLQFIPANCHQFFEQGPKYRRQLLDWGLFHVEPNFNYLWQSYKKVLQQRNSALRQHKQVNEIQLWDSQLASHGEEITKLRKKQLSRLLKEFENIFPRLCPVYENASYELKYRDGWLKGESLLSALTASISRDQQLSYTRSGSHAADWLFKINDCDPSEVFSRGQQKLFYLALCMAQATITAQNNHEASILLFDDLSSELDLLHQVNVLKELDELPVQAFITATELDATLTENHTLFHVKQGRLLESGS